jgi:TorA maturation chaperone TorD
MNLEYSTTASDPALCMARTALYRFAALSLLDPRAGAWEQLRALRRDASLPFSAELLREQAGSRPRDPAAGERPLSDLAPERVLERLPSSADRLNEQYERTFGLLDTGACPPHETDYVNGKFTFQRSQALADVSGFYRAFGLQPSQRHPVRPDHIVLELEFMACLADLERRAAECPEADRSSRVAECQRAQRRFFGEHLAWWAPRFALLLVREAAGGFYERAGVLLGALIAAERALRNIGGPDRTAEPSLLERPEECEGCLVSL